MNPANRTHFLAQYDTINTATFCAKAVFDVEHFLRLSANGLQLAVRNNNYGTLVDELLRTARITTSDSCLIMKNIVHIRNSLHNNGYAGYGFVMLVGSNRYFFTKGQQVKYTGWDSLYIMFDQLIDKLVEIINSKKLKTVKTILHSSEAAGYDMPRHRIICKLYWCQDWRFLAINLHRISSLVTQMKSVKQLW